MDTRAVFSHASAVSYVEIIDHDVGGRVKVIKFVVSLFLDLTIAHAHAATARPCAGYDMSFLRTNDLQA